MSDVAIPFAPTRRLDDRIVVRLAWIGWFAAFALLSAVWPRDAGFDVMHYHLHNGWSALDGRLLEDLAPAEMHSFLNPAYNVLVWWLIERLPGPAVAFLLGLLQAAILPILYGLFRRFSRAMADDMGPAPALALAALGFLCAPAWTGFASIRNDHLGALAYLVGLFLLFSRAGIPVTSAKRLLLASACVGFAAGLKLTNLVYVPGFAVFALLLAEDWGARARAASICAAGGLVAFLAAAGPWMWLLWQEFANPVYPNFAHVFLGPDAPTEASRDLRYLPANLLEAITLPVRASLEGRFINELAVFDLRLGIAYLGALFIVGIAIARGAVARPALALAISVLAILAVWISLFSIMRYAMAVWMLAPLVAWAAWKSTGRKWMPGRGGKALFVGLCFALVATTSPEGVRRVSWDNAFEPYVHVQPPRDLNFDGALIFFAAQFPAGFTATAFPEARLAHIDAQDWSAPFLAQYRRRIEAALSEHEGPLYVVHCWPKRIATSDGRVLTDIYTPEKALQGDGERYRLRLAPQGCREIETNFSTELTTWQICPLLRD